MAEQGEVLETYGARQGRRGTLGFIYDEERRASTRTRDGGARRGYKKDGSRHMLALSSVVD